MEHEDANTFRQTVSEGDIDWLFCVEINSSESFRKWIVSLVFPEIVDFTHIQSWRSVSNSVGESDLIWLIEHPSKGRFMLLIENKINATAQPEQYKRYVQRANGYVSEGLAKEYSIALLSPESYRSTDSSSYPIYISYEKIVKWLQSKQDERSIYLSSIYQAAINKRISSVTINEEILRFREDVWHLAKSEFPLLNIPDPKADSNDYWISMRYTDYTLIYKTYRKGWKFTSSVVDLELSGRGGDIELLEREYAKDLKGTGISVVKTGKSACFRLEVPMIGPPEYEEAKVRNALTAAMVLKTFWETTLA